MKLEQHRNDLHDLETSQLRESMKGMIDRYRRLILTVEEITDKMPALMTPLLFEVRKDAEGGI